MGRFGTLLGSKIGPGPEGILEKKCCFRLVFDLALLGGSWAVLGPSWGGLGPVLGPFGLYLGDLGAHFGSFGGGLRGRFGT